MCTDGPADVLVFDGEEFMGDLFYHNRIMYRRRKTNLFLTPIFADERVLNLRFWQRFDSRRPS